MARHQVWDGDGNLIIDEEVPDEVVNQFLTNEELTQVVAELTAILNAKGLIP